MLVVLGLYLVAVPWRVPIVRAAVMASLVALGYFSGRVVRGLETMALAAVIVHAARLSPFTASAAVPVPSASTRSGAFGKRTIKPITVPGAILKARFSLIARVHFCSSRIGPSHRTTWHDVAKPLKCIMETSVAALKAPLTTICRQLTLPSTCTDEIKIRISNSSSTSPMRSETATRR